MQPEEVLELIGSAPERYDTVRAALRYRGDGSARAEIGERIRNSEEGRRAFGISPDGPDHRLYPDGPFGWSCRAWHADVYHWRLEVDLPRTCMTSTGSRTRSRRDPSTPTGSPASWPRSWRWLG